MSRGSVAKVCSSASSAVSATVSGDGDVAIRPEELEVDSADLFTVRVVRGDMQEGFDDCGVEVSSVLVHSSFSVALSHAGSRLALGLTRSSTCGRVDLPCRERLRLVGRSDHPIRSDLFDVPRAMSGAADLPGRCYREGAGVAVAARVWIERMWHRSGLRVGTKRGWFIVRPVLASLSRGLRWSTRGRQGFRQGMRGTPLWS